MTRQWMVLLLMVSSMARGADGGSPVAASDLNARGVRGELGVPLGTIVTIEGQAVDGESLKRKAYAGVVLLRVDRVDGKKLRAPVMLRASGEEDLMPKAGASFALLAYETGAFSGAPDKLFEHVEPFATTGFAFETSLSLIKRVEKAK